MSQYEDNARKFDPDAPVLLIKIIRAGTSVLRITNDIEDVVTLDGTYKHLPIGANLPSDDGNSVSTATLRMANDPAVINDVNSDNGFERATFILMDILREDPENPIMTLSLTCSRVNMVNKAIEVQLEHKDLYNKRLVNKYFNISTAPGLY